jgi:ubiquinone/menaquinone biosynthesis C-methylase UbiE
MSDMQRIQRTQAQARASYNRLSRSYGWMGEMWERAPRRVCLQQLDIQPGENVLEIGCGTGHDLVTIYKWVGPGGLACGLDLSDGMLSTSTSSLRKAGFSDARLVCGDGLALPFVAGSFDTLYTSFTLELIDTPDIPLFLADCLRLLRPGGRMGVVSLSKSGKSQRMVRIYEWFHSRYPTVVDCRPIYVQEAVNTAGFNLTMTARLSMWGLPVEVVVAKK